MDQKIKILMIADVPRNLLEIKGGLESATVNLISSLKLLPVELHVVTIRGSISQPEIVSLGHDSYIHYYPFTIKKFKALEILLFGQRKIKALYDRLKPDVVHMQGTGPILLMLRGINRDKIVITQHGIMSEEFKYKTSFSHKMKFFLKLFYDKTLLSRFHNYISISEYNRKILSTLQKRNPSFFTSTIFNPVNPDFFKVRDHGKLGIVFVGVVGRRKGLHILIEAMQWLKSEGIEIHLDVAGGTKEPEYYKMILKMINAYRLNDQITMHGWVSQERVKELISKNSLFLLPSQQETLPISIAEAMASGRVVIATNVGGVSEMFTNKESGFLFPRNDVKKLADILRDLVNHPEVIEKVGTYAHQEALRKFEPAAVARQTLAFYQHMSQHQSLHNLVMHDSF